MSKSTQTIGQTLAGKIALVTGGGRGIGAAVSRQLAAAGATVLVNYGKSADAARKVVEQIKAAGGTAHAIPGDVSDPKQVKGLLQTIDREHGGRIDILVNNAGIYKTGPLTELSDADFDSVFGINVRGVFLITRDALKRIPEGGRIITIGSVVGERAVAPGMSIYAASKFAVAGFTRAVAHEVAPRGITANVVEPGPIDTDMNPADPNLNPAAPALTQMIPAKRYGRAEEVAAVVAFLASPGAAYVNGATITVDGGVNA